MEGWELGCEHLVGTDGKPRIGIERRLFDVLGQGSEAQVMVD